MLWTTSVKSTVSSKWIRNNALMCGSWPLLCSRMLFTEMYSTRVLILHSRTLNGARSMSKPENRSSRLCCPILDQKLRAILVSWEIFANVCPQSPLLSFLWTCGPISSSSCANKAIKIRMSPSRWLQFNALATSLKICHRVILKMNICNKFGTPC